MVWDRMEREALNAHAVLGALESLRREMLDYLEAVDGELLQTPITLPVEWFFNQGAWRRSSRRSWSARSPATSTTPRPG